MNNMYDFCPELKNYHLTIENSIVNSMKSFGEETLLIKACKYALLNGGKRFRPIIVLLIADTLGKGYPVIESAIARLSRICGGIEMRRGLG